MEYEQKELETFPSTYIKDYIWFKNVIKTPITTPPDTFALPEEERNNYIREVKQRLGAEELESIKKLYADRMKTTYNVSYCKDSTKVEVSDKDKGGDLIDENTDTMMFEAEKLYSPKTQKLLPPLPTSRRVLGYCRPAYYYTELSEYQSTVAHLGYNILKRYEDIGVARTAPRYDCKNLLRHYKTESDEQ